MRNILIVDDQQGIRLLLNEVFKKEGYRTYLASNGIEALNIFKNEEIDCILLDMKIPGMNGMEILRELRLYSDKINVVMMTAYGEQKLIDEAFQLGATKYFTKPFNIFEVRDAVNEILNSCQSEGV
ncbi:response regulator [Metasolibacillus meyeri]|uniref:Response regulator n=1 Tax=Metasolibacillus meyeri TaxID=1071052 RepID=A0AAW9NGS1_9BACL|nr:response regulator [Metasolibacillus meyeri]MEC1176882.1 response regulator [Metasolibacillus meyeri]